MSFPQGYKTSQEYFYEVNEFLKQNSWIYREANTEFLKADILNEMPQEFKDYFQQIGISELNRFPYVHEPLSNLTCQTLVHFRESLAKLIPREAFNEPTDIAKPIKSSESFKRMNVKKQHEIQRFAALVKASLEKRQAESEEKHILIDLGCGLGYISELLFKLNENVLILGLEANADFVEAAERRIKAYFPTAINSIQYRQHCVTENSKEFIVKAVEEVLKLNYQCVPQQTATKMVIIGLHACADLTITSMRLFLQLPHIQQLVIMPCCYHKLQVCDDVAATNNCGKKLKFKNFPLSESLKQVLSHKAKEEQTNDNINHEAFTKYLNRPFLRLACQQTLKRWSNVSALEHRAHGCEMFFRAVVELVRQAEQEEEDEEREFIIVKRKYDKIDFKSLADEQLESFEIFRDCYMLKRKSTQEIVEWTEKHRQKFNGIVKKYPNGAKMAEGLTCLQTSMQKLCENLVLYDRLCYMEETSFKMNLKIKVRYEKIMDEELSPRCYALIAEKL